jgi:tRNA-dihydrouridine synthase 3
MAKRRGTSESRVSQCTATVSNISDLKIRYILSKKTEAPSYRNDDEAEASKDGQVEEAPKQNGRGGKFKKERGQNKGRKFGSWGDKLILCNSRALSPEFSPGTCRFGDKCNMEHDLRKYLAEGKAADLTTFDGKCPSFEEFGSCPVGWKCRFVGSHSKEAEHEDGRKELVLDYSAMSTVQGDNPVQQLDKNIANVVSMKDKIDLNRRRVKLPQSDAYLQWLEKIWNVEMDKKHNNRNVAQLSEAEQTTANGWSALIKEKEEPNVETPKLETLKNENVNEQITTYETTEGIVKNEIAKEEIINDESSKAKSAKEANAKEANVKVGEIKSDNQDHRASYLEPPLRPSEKRRLYYGPETPILAPLTTQGNLPFRRLCVSLGAQVTFSEMAMGLPLLSGEKSEWALMKAHQDEITPPKVSETASSIVQGYDNSKDLKFGVQISAAKPWVGVKTAEVLAKYCPSIRAIDLNCGCPIDLVYKSGAGSALLDFPSKLEKILRGMNTVSGEIPITAKIRTGTRDNKPTAINLVERLVLGSMDAQESGMGPCGVAAITLHGRSRQQRYSRQADWTYIADVAATIADLRTEEAARTDTSSEADARNLPNGGRVLFVGNGDVYCHEDYFTHIQDAKVDSCMIGRGALIKPWIFEEIASNQYLDKSATERLDYIKQFVRYGLDCWGSDEMGVGTTRRFLLEWLSFSCRYVPIGILERMPPRLNERPPPYQGRNELETLLASDNYLDWIKISEMFLGKANEGFRFVPKHKSNSYETEG